MDSMAKRSYQSLKSFIPGRTRGLDARMLEWLVGWAKTDLDRLTPRARRQVSADMRAFVMLHWGRSLANPQPEFGDWPDGQAVVMLQSTVQRVLRGLVDVAQKGHGQLDAVTIKALDVVPVMTSSDRPAKWPTRRPTTTKHVVWQISGSPRDLFTHRFVTLLEAVALPRLRRCAATDCARVFVKKTRGEYCSRRCQMRTYMRGAGKS
jgi:hypothetical protein